jgi:hypothetical protein
MNHISLSTELSNLKIFILPKLKYYFFQAYQLIMKVTVYHGTDMLYCSLVLPLNFLKFLYCEEDNLSKIKITTLPEWSDFFDENQLPIDLVEINHNLPEEILLLCLEILLHYSTTNNQS